ncbi:ABC transporter ATP-binding protein [Cryobacterium sp. 1639]|uniref:ABC transporter ATP-binding protein n=1 Tax=Cryobacterium inferilacus TaxID=2866629 RepID=UPI001C73042F|nr:ABC transporter ATP-binding protein [Cryobacterium sp. 1639]MBX0301174.1 ABC transporter ATP-binding protein [Cryobacterium sp. 1639]
MSGVSVEDLRVGYGDAVVLDGITLTIPRGSLVAVLGPSGCGKTTLLRAIAGLLPATAGTIRVGDRLLSSARNTVPPEKRGIGWVPQDAALFPHLSVGENIGFGLPRGGRGGREARRARIDELAAIVGLGGLTERAPSQLSGGQAQRVSLARALASRPDLMLLDEPFAALDPLLRSALRIEVAELLRSQQNTSLLVTHDQEEALSLADFIAVMRHGRILQWGTPAEVYERPASLWVAGFVGDTVELDGRWSDGRAECAFGLLDAAYQDGPGVAEPQEGASVRVMLRPEWLRVVDDRGDADPTDTGARGVPATVTAIAYAGHDALVSVLLDSGQPVRARIAAPDLPARGTRVRVSIRHPVLAYPVRTDPVPADPDSVPDDATLR